MTGDSRGHIALCAIAVFASSAAGAARAEAARSIALTFDDVPGVAMVADRCDAAGWEAFNQSMVDAIRRSRAPALGLVTAGRVCDELRDEILPSLLTEWLDAGAELGNHSFMHRDLNSTPAADYIADLDRTAQILEDLSRQHGNDHKYFRYPFLHAGDDQQTKRAVENALAARGLINAPVTIDNQEWVFAAVYAAAKRRGDRQTMARVAEAYVPYMESVVAFFERYAVRVLGYEPPQVLLLHANELNADYLDELLAMLSGRGYRFITMDEALLDRAYAQPDPYVGPVGLSWLHRWAIAAGVEQEQEPREPEWLAKLLEEY